MARRNLQKIFSSPMCLSSSVMGWRHRKMISFYHSLDKSDEVSVPSEWYERAYPKLIKLTHQLKNVDLIDGRVINMDDNSIIFDDSVEQSLYTFKSLARDFLGSPLVLESMRKNVMSSSVRKECSAMTVFAKPSERQPMTLNSLTKVCNFLDISAQQRNVVRLKVCPQITQHRIWTGALVEILSSLKCEIESMNNQSSTKGILMGQQIISSCLEFLDETTTSYDLDSTSWMRPTPAKMVNSIAPRKWEAVLEMFKDLIKSMRNENKLQFYATKLDLMKEGLFQIKDVPVDRNVGYKDIRHQESLVQKLLSKTLGHSSRCLFTLLQYYLHSSIRDIEIEICGGIYRDSGGDKYCIYMGRILASDQEKMVQSGVKQLDRALGLYKFVWETSGCKGALELEGHLWCVGAESRSLMYRGNMYYIHEICC